MATLLPNQTYYRACVGVWACSLDFAITDHEAFRAAPLTARDRLRIRSMLATAAAFGAPRLTTTVAMAGDDEVVHTTRVAGLGVPMLRSREVLTLEPDGARFTMRIDQRDFPFFASRPSSAHGFVDPTATVATYHLDFFGVPMLQTTLRDGDRVTLTQKTAFSLGVQRLVRIRP